MGEGPSAFLDLGLQHMPRWESPPLGLPVLRESQEPPLPVGVTGEAQGNRGAEVPSWEWTMASVAHKQAREALPVSLGATAMRSLWTLPCGSADRHHCLTQQGPKGDSEGKAGLGSILEASAVVIQKK